MLAVPARNTATTNRHTNESFLTEKYTKYSVMCPRKYSIKCSNKRIKYSKNAQSLDLFGHMIQKNTLQFYNRV
jgi:hypothetical protein